MNKIKLDSRFLDNGDEIVEVIIPETRSFVTVTALDREYGDRAHVVSSYVSTYMEVATHNVVWDQENQDDQTP